TSTVAVFGDTHSRVADETYRQGGPWLSEYDRTKWIAHYEVVEPMARAGLPLVIVQPGGGYGPGDPGPPRPILRDHLRRRLTTVPKGTALSWTHVEDAARGHHLAMERGRPGESYIIAGPSHTVLEALEIAERITGVPVPRLRLAPGTLKTLAALMRQVERL